jgi:hypothetical protein
MKLKLVTYCVALALSLSAFLYAGPDYRKLSLPQGTPAAKPVPTVSVKKQDINVNKKNRSHQFKSRILNSTCPIQRCIKTLKI